MVKTILGLFLLGAASPGQHLKPLPVRARITIEPQHWIAKTKPGPEDECPVSRKLTERQVRRMFATYHVLAEGEYHDGYAQIDCVTEGEIVVDGKKFRYMSQPYNLLFTNWPDGQDHQLGGKHTDDSASQ
jgi:hypothetical protein